MSDTPIYDEMILEEYARRAREAYAASPGMIGCGQWELPDVTRPPRVPMYERVRRQRPDARRAVRLVHQRSQTIPLTCTEDGKPWPCPTVEALRNAEVSA